MAKQVNKQRYMYLFSRLFPRPWTVTNGPAKSTADLVNSRSDGFSLDVDKDTIICEHDFDFRRQQTAHSLSHLRISSRPESSQYRADRAASVWLVPVAWLPLSLCSFTISCLTQLFLGRMIGYRKWYGRDLVFFRRPSDRISLSSSSFG